MSNDKLIKVTDYLVQVIRCVLNNQKVEPINDESFSYQDLYSLARFHQVENIVFEGVRDYIDDPKLKNHLNKKYLQNITMCLTQEEEKKTLEKAFSEQKIKFMPVKGYYLRSLYPRDDFRFMSDFDILIEKGKHRKVKNMMKGLNYEVEQYNYYHHDEYTKKPFIMIEMHRTLLPQDDNNYSYYQDPFSLAKPIEDNKYCFKMSDEDLYIFNLVHFHKHYLAGGSGIRYLMDIYISLTRQNLNSEYIASECKKLKIEEFKALVENIALKWFKEGLKINSLSDEELYIIQSGAFGTLKNHVERNIDDYQGSKIKLIFKRTFPNVKRMKVLYPVLNKCILLLPFCYIHRVFRGIFSKSAHKELKEINKKHSK